MATLPPPDAGLFDIVLALGVLHHLSNEESLALLRSAKEHLKPGGRVVTFDGCRRGNTLEAVMYALDRGRAINDAEGYARLGTEAGLKVEACDTPTDMLRPWIPYTHCVMTLS